jgi:hypothetical protein
MRLTLLFTFLFSAVLSFGQEDWRLYAPSTKENIELNLLDTSDQNQYIEGNITVYSDSRIDSLVSHLDANPPEIKGYRVQVFFGNRNEAENIKAAFLRKFNQWPIYIVWQQPDFKIQVGDFLTKIEAEKVQHEIISSYPNAYPIYTTIKLSD